MMHGQKNIKLGTLCRCNYVGVEIPQDDLSISFWGVSGFWP